MHYGAVMASIDIVLKGKKREDLSEEFEVITLFSFRGYVGRFAEYPLIRVTVGDDALQSIVDEMVALMRTQYDVLVVPVNATFFPNQRK